MYDDELGWGISQQWLLAGITLAWSNCQFLELDAPGLARAGSRISAISLACRF